MIKRKTRLTTFQVIFCWSFSWFH